MLGAVHNSSIAALLATRSATAVSGAVATSPVAEPQPANGMRISDRISLTGGANALRDVGVTVESLSRAGSTLAVAGASLAQIAEVLDRVQSAFEVPETGQEQRQEQVDAALTQIDKYAGSAQFGGRPLLNGSYTVTLPGEGLTLPAVSSRTLGKAEPGAPSIASFGSNGSAPLATDRPVEVTAAFERATGQVIVIQAQIEAFRSRRLNPTAHAVRSLLESSQPASQTIHTPEQARTNVLLLRAQVIINPLRSRDALSATTGEHTLHLTA